MKISKKQLIQIISETVQKHLNEDYGWEIKRGKEYDALDDAIENFGAETVLHELSKAMSKQELADNLAFMFRMHNYESPYLVS